MPDVDDAFARVLVVLAETFGASLTETRIRSYAEGLGDLTLEQVQAAAARARRELRFFPQVAELRAFVTPSAEDAAVLAWTALAEAASAVGAYASLEFEDRYAAAAVRQVFGSWPHYCSLDAPAVHAKRTDFLAAYREARRHYGDTSPRLAGLCEAGAGLRQLPGVWRGYITAGGQVEARAARPVLPTHTDWPALPAKGLA